MDGEGEGGSCSLGETGVGVGEMWMVESVELCEGEAGERGIG